MNSQTLGKGQKAIELINRWVRARKFFEQTMRRTGDPSNRPWDNAAVDRLNAAEASMKRFWASERKAP